METLHFIKFIREYSWSLSGVSHEDAAFILNNCLAWLTETTYYGSKGVENQAENQAAFYKIVSELRDLLRQIYSFSRDYQEYNYGRIVTIFIIHSAMMSSSISTNYHQKTKDCAFSCVLSALFCKSLKLLLQGHMMMK
jgi:hypothetical protein